MVKIDDSTQKETHLIQRIGFYSFLLNLSLTCLKAYLAQVSGSLAIVAGTVDSATDSIASLAVWGGLKLASRKSRAFPYGLYKIENVIQVGMALLIILVGYEIARETFQAPGEVPWITPGIIGGMTIGVVLPLIFGRYTIAIGRRTASPALVADGRHRQADVLSSVVVLAAIVTDYAGLRFSFHGVTLDHIAAGLVLVFIGYTGLELLVTGMRVLLDASLDAALLDRVRRIIEAEPAVVEIRTLVGRNAGRFRFLETELVLRTHNLEKAHAISKRIESAVLKEVRNVDRVLIHYEPPRRDKTAVAVPLESDRKTLSTHFGEAPVFYIGILRTEDGRLLEERFLANPFLEEEKAKGIKVSQWLLGHGVDLLFTTASLEGRGPGYVLSDAGVMMRVTEKTELGEVRREWAPPPVERESEATNPVDL
ncbi:MAG: cation diffusion facilitator family transporter [Deltaproteobacteria bacterium]|nr:cation diffusion facilitator family transporter [Deltaproteobacteria bacterium]